MKRRPRGAAPAGRGPSIALLLLGVNVFVLLLPMAGLVLYRVYDIYLLRQTERQLIAQSVVVGEAYRDAYLREPGISPGELRPPGTAQEKYVPIEPLIDLGTEVRPHEELLHLPAAPPDDSPERRAGAQINAMLERAQIFNLSGVRVLDRRGCVVASSGGEQGRCLTPLAEVQRALGGEYASNARYRMPSNPLPPLGSIQRRGQLRVFTALPIFSDGEVIGIVTASRTGLDALSSLWHIRRALVWSVLATVVVLVSISLLFARAIARPMHSITQKAEAIARGEPGTDFVPRGFTPKEVRTLSLALDVMTRKLRAQAEYVSEFATTVSHELKTPIAAIRGAAELLLDWDRMDGAQRDRFLRNIDQDAERMQRLVTRLLELAKIEAAQDVPSARVPVVTFVRRVLERYGSRVVLELEAPPETVEISEEHLGIALQNLVDNAVRHAPDAPVRVVLGSDAKRLCIVVEDRGPGISPANQGRIWDRFFTTERDRGGTGLGLSIVAAIAKAHRGSVDFTSSERGTRFRLVL
ncbi:MAG TPA: ATP-binding protein [Polyangiaceae bacterium]|nr:ATP-binding protein [Polyangiaceae bacterium]